MELTWIAIIASLLMGIGTLLIVIFAVKQDCFRDLEQAKNHISINRPAGIRYAHGVMKG